MYKQKGPDALSEQGCLSLCQGGQKKNDPKACKKHPAFNTPDTGSVLLVGQHSFYGMKPPRRITPVLEEGDLLLEKEQPKMLQVAKTLSTWAPLLQLQTWAQHHLPSFLVKC